MWEHKNEMSSDGNTSRDETAKDSETKEISMKVKNSVELKVEKQDQDVPRDENNMQLSHDLRGNDVMNNTGNGKITSDEIGKENDGKSEERVEGFNETDNELKTPGKKLTEEGKDSSGLVTKEVKTLTSLSTKQGELLSEHLSRSSTKNPSVEQNDNNETQKKEEKTRDEKELARTNDISARNIQDAARNNIVENTRNVDEGKSLNENNMNYSGEDLAFVNLLEEVEGDQTFFDEQLDKLEKQVESKYDVISNK